MRKDALPVVITQMREIPLGPIVERLTREFDESEEIRIGVISGAFTMSAYQMDLESAREEIGDRKRMRDFASGVWHRDKNAGYLDYLDLVIAKLSGETIEIVKDMADFETTMKLDGFRSIWAENHAFRGIVDNLRRSIERALWWFNQQLMNIWLERAQSHRMSIPYCKAIFEDESFGQQSSLIDRHCYFEGAQTIGTLVAKSYDALMQAAVPETLRGLFEVDQELLTKFAIAKRGHDPEVIDRRKAKREKKKEEPKVAVSDETPEEEEEIPSAWKTTESGIIVPSTFNLESR